MWRTAVRLIIGHPFTLAPNLNLSIALDLGLPRCYTEETDVRNHETNVCDCREICRNDP